MGIGLGKYREARIKTIIKRIEKQMKEIKKELDLIKLEIFRERIKEHEN